MLFVLFFACDATEREWERLQALLGNIGAAFRTRTVLTRVELDERPVNEDQCLRAHLEQGEFDLAAALGVRRVDRIAYVIRSAGAAVVPAAIDIVLDRASACVEYLS